MRFICANSTSKIEEAQDTIVSFLLSIYFLQNIGFVDVISSRYPFIGSFFEIILYIPESVKSSLNVFSNYKRSFMNFRV